MTEYEYNCRRNLLRAESLGACLGIANALRLCGIDNPPALKIAAESLIEEADRYVAKVIELDREDRLLRVHEHLAKGKLCLEQACRGGNRGNTDNGL